MSKLTRRWLRQGLRCWSLREMMPGHGLRCPAARILTTLRGSFFARPAGKPLFKEAVIVLGAIAVAEAAVAR